MTRTRLIALGAVLALSFQAAGTAGAGGGGTQAQSGIGAQPPSGAVVDSGVGMYTDSSVANQLSTFTINPRIITCGVGTLANGQWTGPFAMLMYSTRIDKYAVDQKAGVIRVSGRMRSVTRAGGSLMEDVEHDFLSIAATDSAHLATPDRHNGVARFDIHFTTPFWSANNPMCTPSTVEAGGCRFGGDVVEGEIVVQGHHAP